MGALGVACAGIVLGAGCSHGEDVAGPSDLLTPGFPGFAGTDAGIQPSFFTGPRPSFPPTVTASTPPPPISGGTLLVTQDGKTAVAADPDRDAIYGIDLASLSASPRR